MSRSAIALAAAALTLATAAPASASSIAFVRAGDVWLVTPDGTREHRVTTGGSYSSVTQADDGTLFAHRAGILDRLDRNGNAVAPAVGIGHMLDPDVSPDGSKIGFWYASGDGPRVTAVNADGSPSGFDDQNGWHLSWIGNDVALYSNGAGWISTMRTGLGGWDHWFSAPDGRKHESALTRAGDRVVVVVRDYEDAGPWSVVHYTTAGPAPAEPALRCTTDAGAAEPRHASWAPDGTAIAWELPDGVHVRPALDLASCTQPPGGFSLPGATSPDWGPADVPAAAAPAGSALRSFAVPRGQRLRRALARGLRVKVVCTGPCRTSGRLRAGRRTVATGAKQLSSGTGTVTLRFTRAGRRRLAGMRRATLRLQVTVGDVTRTRRVTLRR